MSWTQHKLSKLPDVLLPLQGHTSVLSGERDIFIFGGYDYLTDRASNTLYLLNTNNQTNALTKPHTSGVITARYGHTATQVGRKMFVFGGNVELNDIAQCNDMYQLNTINLSWSKPKVVGDVPLPRSGHTAVLINDTYILVYGGFHKDRALNDVYIFHTDRNSWVRLTDSSRGSLSSSGTLLPNPSSPSTPTQSPVTAFLAHSSPSIPMPTALFSSPVSRGRSATISHATPPLYQNENNITTPMTTPTKAPHSPIMLNPHSPRHHLFPFQSTNNSPVSLLSTTLISKVTPPARFNHSCNIIGSKAYFFGGCDGTALYNDVHLLNIDTLEWSVAEVSGDIPSPRSGHSSVVVGLRIFVFGGTTDIVTPSFNNQLYILDTESMEWSNVTTNGQLPSPRFGHNILSLSSRLIILGGYDSLLNYSLPLKSIQPPPPQQHHHHQYYYILETLRLEFKSSKQRRNTAHLSSSSLTTTSTNQTFSPKTQDTQYKDGADSLEKEREKEKERLRERLKPLIVTNNRPPIISNSADTITNNMSMETFKIGESCSSSCNLKYNILAGQYTEIKQQLREEREKRKQLEKELESLKSLNQSTLNTSNNSNSNILNHSSNNSSVTLSSSMTSKQSIEMYEEMMGAWSAYEKRLKWKELLEKDTSLQLDAVRQKLDQFTELFGLYHNNDTASDTSELYDVRSRSSNVDEDDLSEASNDYSSTSVSKKLSIPTTSHGRSSSYPIPILSIKKKDKDKEKEKEKDKEREKEREKDKEKEKERSLSSSLNSSGEKEKSNNIFKLLKSKKINRSSAQFQPLNGIPSEDESESTLPKSPAKRIDISGDSTQDDLDIQENGSGQIINSDSTQQQEKSKTKIGSKFMNYLSKEKEKEKEPDTKKDKEKDKKSKKIKLFGKSKESLPFRKDIIEKVVDHLNNHALEVEGIFRLSGNMDTVKTVVKSFSHGEPNLNFEIHNISNALKHYLRSLDPPLIPYEFFIPLLDSRKNEDVETIRNMIWRIPNDNRTVLTLLVELLVKITQRCEVNKMNAKNLSIVFGPTILKPKTPTLDRMALMTETQLQCGIMQTFIEDFDYVFSEQPSSQPKSFTKFDSDEGVDEESISLSALSTPSSQSPPSASPHISPAEVPK